MRNAALAEQPLDIGGQSYIIFDHDPEQVWYAKEIFGTAPEKAQPQWPRIGRRD